MDARSEFYQACLDDRDVRGVGFTPEDDFPIRRNSFASRAAPPERKKDNDPWEVAEEQVIVTSPNWNRDDRKRQWKGFCAGTKECFFTVEDEQFWTMLRSKTLTVEVLDKLKVQWAYQLKKGKPANRRVLKVLEFNGKALAKPLSMDELVELLGEVQGAGDHQRRQRTLFDN